MFAEIINLKIKNMLIYNTTFQVDDEVHDNFLIWIKESYIPEVEKHGALRAPRIWLERNTGSVKVIGSSPILSTPN